jgi:hypothetical protein
MHGCLSALLDIGVVLQDRRTDGPACLYQVCHFVEDPLSRLIKHWLSQPVLPAVPTAVPEVLVLTGKKIPCSGIWEPVRTGRPSGPQTTRKGLPYQLPDSWEVDGRTLDGTMNYLHAKVAAPTIAFDEDDADYGRPTTWRLLWRDDRYGDNPVPEEESRYLFVQPVRGEAVFTYGGVPHEW